MEPLEGRRLLSSSITTEFYNGDDPGAQGNPSDHSGVNDMSREEAAQLIVVNGAATGRVKNTGGNGTTTWDSGDGTVNDGEEHQSVGDVMGSGGPTAIDVPPSSYPGGPGGGGWTPRTDIDITFGYDSIHVPAGTEVTFAPNGNGGWRITGFIVPKGGKAPSGIVAV